MGVSENEPSQGRSKIQLEGIFCKGTWSADISMSSISDFTFHTLFRHYFLFQTLFNRSMNHNCFHLLSFCLLKWILRVLEAFFLSIQSVESHAAVFWKRLQATCSASVPHRAQFARRPSLWWIQRYCPISPEYSAMRCDNIVFVLLVLLHRTVMILNGRILKDSAANGFVSW